MSTSNKILEYTPMGSLELSVVNLSILRIPTGLVEGSISARAADHIWMGQKANWLNLREIGGLSEHDGDPTEESNAHLFEPLGVS